jgi:hypothetical protein
MHESKSKQLNGFPDGAPPIPVGNPEPAKWHLGGDFPRDERS